MADLIVVDASVLYEVITAGPLAPAATAALASAHDHAAPEIIDVEVTGLIRRDAQHHVLDGTRSQWALDRLRDWPGDRFPHRPFIRRVWHLRENVRTTDAFYVALAEALDVPLMTLDGRLARASGVNCQVLVPGDE